MRSKVRMIGYNAKGQVVYTDCLETGDFYDGDHVWDHTESILALNLVKVIGEKFDDEGNISESWETAFSSETGCYIGSVAFYADGTVKREGIYETMEDRHVNQENYGSSVQANCLEME